MFTVLYFLIKFIWIIKVGWKCSNIFLDCCINQKVQTQRETKESNASKQAEKVREKSKKTMSGKCYSFSSCFKFWTTVHFFCFELSHIDTYGSSYRECNNIRERIELDVTSTGKNETFASSLALWTVEWKYLYLILWWIVRDVFLFFVI